MALTISGYFTIDDVAKQLEVATLRHLGQNHLAYGSPKAPSIEPPSVSRYYWTSADLYDNFSFFQSVPQFEDTVKYLQQVALLHHYFAEPKMAITVTGSLNGKTILQTNALDISRGREFAQGLGIPGPQKSFLIWNYSESIPQYTRAIRELWIPDRNQKLETLEQMFARPMPPPPQ